MKSGWFHPGGRNACYLEISKWRQPNTHCCYCSQPFPFTGTHSTARHGTDGRYYCSPDCETNSLRSQSTAAEGDVMKCARDGCKRHLGLGLCKLILEGRQQYFCGRGWALTAKQQALDRTRSILRWLFNSS